MQTLVEGWTMNKFLSFAVIGTAILAMAAAAISEDNGSSINLKSEIPVGRRG